MSPAFQGRVDDENYKKSLALCLNYIPTQEGSLVPRSGFKRIGNTKTNSPARLLPFRFTPYEPYVAEFTANNLRLWSNDYPVLDDESAILQSVAGSPPVFTILGTGDTVIPSKWANGDSILIQIDDATDIQTAGYLCFREFTLTIVSSTLGTITLTDAVTGVPLSAAVTIATPSETDLYRIIDFDTYYRYPEGIRQVQLSDQKVTSVPGSTAVTVSPPDQRVTFLYPIVSPQSLSREYGPAFGLIAEDFIDGPYLDSFGTTIPMTVDATTGTLNCVLHGYDAGIIYQKGDIAISFPSGYAQPPRYFLSLTANNKGNALPTSTPFVSAYWVELFTLESDWDSGKTYHLGNAVTWGARDADNVETIYYSLNATNANKNPLTQPTYWTTTLPAWDSLETYPANAYVTDVGIKYVSVSVPVVGTAPAAAPTVWIVVDLPTAVDKLGNIHTGYLSAPLFYKDDPGGSTSTLGQTEGTRNPSRLIRLKWGPQGWNNTHSYSIGDTVNFNDNIYKSLVNSNLNNQPDVSADDWELQTTTILWTWGKITDAHLHTWYAKIELLGADLPTDDPIWEFRFGVFSDTTGWPTCGEYHEGRLWLAGPTPNRIDGGKTNEGFNFAPTAPDGSVADNNAIAYVLNSSEAETIAAFRSISEGLSLFTSEGEWLVSASALNDPITPTSIQAHRTGKWAANPIEPTGLPSAIAVAQKGGRRVLEYRTFADTTSYQARLNTVDLTRRAQHLTTRGIGVTAYQSLPQPILWCCPPSGVNIGYLRVDWPTLTHGTCPNQIDQPDLATTLDSSTFGGKTLFGIGYARTPELSYAAPFSFEHGLTLSTGFQQAIDSIAVQRAFGEGKEYLYATVCGSDGKTYMEMLQPPMESNPLASTYNVDNSIATFGTLASAYYVDSGRSPVGAKIAADGLSVTYYGMPMLAGQTVSFTILGKYIGDVTIGSSGTVNIPFSDRFLISDVGRAIYAPENSTTLPISGWFNRFFLDDNGVDGTCPPDSGQHYGYLGQFGYSFRRRGQMLRPQVGSQNGPTFAKIMQNARMGVYIDAGQQIKIGSDFANLKTLDLFKDPNQNKDVTALGPGDFTTGIFRDSVEGDYDFNAQLCWEQTDPVPGAIIAVGGFDETSDV